MKYTFFYKGLSVDFNNARSVAAQCLGCLTHKIKIFKNDKLVPGPYPQDCSKLEKYIRDYDENHLKGELFKI